MTALLVDLAPRNGVWTVPAADSADEPHTIALGQWAGARRPDGEPVVELLLHCSHDVGILVPDEARTLAAALLAAADYADDCQIVGDVS